VGQIVGHPFNPRIAASRRPRNSTVRGKRFGVFVDIATVAGHVGAQSVDLDSLSRRWFDVS
jgi:hypothetical protein